MIPLFPIRWWIASKSHKLVTIPLHSSELSESHILKALEVNSCFLMWLHHTKLKFLCRTLGFCKTCYLTSCLSHNSTKWPRKKRKYLCYSLRNINSFVFLFFQIKIHLIKLYKILSQKWVVSTCFFPTDFWTGAVTKASLCVLSFVKRKYRVYKTTSL